VLDSVVMPGARVEEGAVVVRSVVFDGGIVRRGVAVVDCCVSTLGVFTDADLSVAGLPE
jgi:ADP-glucose pyrophosphorylase